MPRAYHRAAALHTHAGPSDSSRRTAEKLAQSSPAGNLFDVATRSGVIYFRRAHVAQGGLAERWTPGGLEAVLRRAARREPRPRDEGMEGCKILP